MGKGEKEKGDGRWEREKEEWKRGRKGKRRKKRECTVAGRKENKSEGCRGGNPSMYE